jgi:membrane-associated phospholipid phosphatase
MDKIAKAQKGFFLIPLKLFLEYFDRRKNKDYLVKFLRLLFLGFPLFTAISLIFSFFVSFVDKDATYLSKNLPPIYHHLSQLLTKIGDSLYIFIVCTSLIFLSLTLLKKTAGKKIKMIAKVVISHCMLFFFSTLFSGLIAQIIKHLVGRARPKLIEEFGIFNLKGLSFQASFASLPSGHSVTAFSIAYLLTLYMPKYRIVFYLIATSVGISRVVLGSHYPSDVIAGAVLGIFCTFLIAKLFTKKKIALVNMKGITKVRGRKISAFCFNWFFK